MLLISTHKPHHVSENVDKKLRDFYKNDDKVMEIFSFLKTTKYFSF